MEELSLNESFIETMRVIEPYEVNDVNIDRVWVVYPVLVTLKSRPTIVLDWEHSDFAWILPEQLGGYDYVPDFDKSVARTLAQLTA